MLRKCRGSISEVAAFQDLDMFSNSLNSLDNEIEILKSRSLLAEVIKKLDLNIQYNFEGRIRTIEYYNNAPVKLHFLDGDSVQNISEFNLKLTILSDSLYLIENEELGEIGRFSFDKKAITPYGELKISRNNFKMPSNLVVNIIVELF